VAFGVDPKTVVCIFYKQGNCDKGRKCKFSHDLAVERKGEKKNLYQDTREGEEEEEKKKDDMVDWDEGESGHSVRRLIIPRRVYTDIIRISPEKLRQVVLSKHGNPKTTTDKVCKYFIDAVENGKYGWFWSCPNGGDKCMYKHSLPPGYFPRSYIPSNPPKPPKLTPDPPPHSFILKTKEQRATEKALLDKSPLKTLTLEDFLESERHKLSGTLTPVTPETFAKWKKERLDKKAAEQQAREAKEATGRAMFEKGGWEDEEDNDDSEEDESEEEGEEGDNWDMEELRLETEKIAAEKEKERIAGLGGGQVNIEGTNGVDGEIEDQAVGVGEVVTNGVNGHASE